MDTRLQKAKVGSMVTHTSIFTPGRPDNTKRGTHSSGGPGPLPPASSSHLPPDVISSRAVHPPGPSWLDQAQSRHRYSSVPSTMNHTALSPRAPGLWGSHPGPQNAGRRHCFSTRAVSLCPIILISLWSKAWHRQLGTACIVLTHTVDLISMRKTPLHALNPLLAEGQGGIPNLHRKALLSS